jgi:hypothetical protein
MFPGYFEYNSNLVEEPYYHPTGGESIVKNQRPNVSGYVYDSNLTETFISQVKGFSPMDPIQVNWSVFRLVDRQQYPNYHGIRVYAQPKIRTTQIWELYEEGNIDAMGNPQFYSLDNLIKEITG